MGKLCICVSGQMRASDTGLRRLKEALGDRDATLVFSVWNRFGRKSKGALNMDQLPRIFGAGAIPAFPSRWLGWTAFLAALPTLLPVEGEPGQDDSEAIRDLIRTHFPQAVIDIEDDALLDLSFDTPKEDGNSIRMLYKIWRANEIKRKLERSAGRFDAVFRTRPDAVILAVDDALLADRAGRKTIFVNDFVPGGTFVGDILAAGSSEALDRYAGLFGRVIADRDGWHFIHTELHEHLTAGGYAYEAYPHYGGLAADVTVSVRDFLEHLDGLADEATWTPLHEIVRTSLRALDRLAESDAPGALSALRTLEEADDTSSLDGYLTVLGMALDSAGRTLEAIWCWLLVDALADTRHSYEFNRAYRPHLIARLIDRLDASGASDTTSLLPFEDVAPQVETLAAEFPALRIVAVETPDALAARVSTILRGPDAQYDLLQRITATKASSLSALCAAADGIIDDVYFIYDLAQALKLAGGYPLARSWQTKALELAPDHPGAVRQMAEILYHGGEVQEAERFARRALELAPDMPDHRILVAYADYRAGRVPDTEAELDFSSIRPGHDFERLPFFARFREDRARG